MNHKRSIILLIAALGYFAGFTSTHAAMHDRAMDLQSAQRAGTTAAVGPTKAQAEMGVYEAKEKVAKAKKAAPTSGVAEASGEDAIKALGKLSQYGEGVLSSVKNNTKSSINIQSSGGKTINDQLPEGTIVRIKSLDPQFGAEGKYYSLRKSKDAKDPDGFSFKPDTSDPKDKATYFVINRRVSKNLKDWLGFTHPISDGKTLQVSPKTYDLGFFNKDFREESATQSHWSIVGKSLKSCALKNRKTGGLLTYFSGEKEFRTTKSEPLTDTFGVQQAGFEIITAVLSDDRSQFNVTDVIKAMALKDGKIAIPGDLYEFFGKTTPPAEDLNAKLTIRVKNANIIEEIVIKNGTKSNPTNYVFNLPYQRVKGVIPVGGAQIGVMVKLEGKDWRGPALEYNTLISIASDKHPTHILWTHGANHYGKHDDFIVGNPSEVQLYNGAHLFLIRSKADPKKTGPINYGEEIEIWSVFRSANEFWRTDIPAGEVSIRKVWVQLLNWAHSRFWITDPNGSNLDDNDKKTVNSSQSTFTLASPNKLTGIVYQSDLVNIVSKARTNNGDDAKGFNADEQKRYADQKMWFDFSNWSHYWGDGRVEVFLRDEWGAQGNRYMNHYLPEEPRELKYNLPGDRSIRWGDFRIQAANTRFVDPKTLAAIYAAAGITPQDNPGKLIQISAKNNKEVWGVNTAQEVWKWNGTTWAKIPTPNPLKQVCVSAQGEIWGVSVDNKVWQYTKPNWVPLGGDNMKHIAITSGDNAWGIGEDDFIYQFNGTIWEKNTPEEGGIIALSASGSGDAWATDIKKRTWKMSKGSGWVAVNSPADKSTLIQLAVRNDKDVWATSDEGAVYHWDGKTWEKQPGRLCYVAVDSGTKTVVLKSEKRNVQEGTTTDAKDKPLSGPAAKIALEIVQLGIGGNLPAGKTVEVNIPVRKAPKVTGFATTKIDSFEAGAKLVVTPLLSKGAAWPENSLMVPGRTSVSFLASPEDAGDVQVLFGPEISDNYTWKVVIGGWNNTKSAIIKRTVTKGMASETVMYEISKKQNPFAFAPPGRFTPYWVSYDKGFIMVGMGLPGQNIFMAQRVKEVGEAEITRVGFGSNKTNVEYTEIQFSPPVIIKKPERVYARSTESISVGANQAAFTWTKYPFRSNDRGSVSFTMQGTDNVVLALGQDTSNDKPHYAIVFSSEKASITIKKWVPSKKQYVDRAILPKSTYPAINLDPSKKVPVWVSFEEGVFAIGHGDIGENPILVFTDLNDYTGINTVGFGTFGANPATITNLQATPPVLMRIEEKEEAYRTSQSWYQFKGAVTVIMPFEYQFTQKDDSVIATDLLSNEVFYAAATPGAGNVFKFILKINFDGFPEFVWETEPENITQTKVKQALVQTSAAAELQKAKAELEVKEGARLRQVATAASKIEKAKYDSMMGVASTMTSAATAAAMAAGPDITISSLALGSALGLGIGGIAVAGAASKFAIDAAQVDFEGAKVESLHKAKGLELEAAGNKLQFQSNLLSGNAQFAFKDPRSYVFVDNPQRAALGAADLPPEVLANAQKANDLINAAGLIKPTDKKNFEILVSTLQDVVFLITHSFVVSDILKQKFMLYLGGLFSAYTELFTAKPNIRVTNDFINLLFTAMNSGYLFSSAKAEDIEKDAENKEAIYVWINKLSHNLLMKLPSISLKPCYGEYIWLPIPLTKADQAVVELTVEGRHDVLVCFSKEPEKVRNTPKDIYEIVLAGWDNTKHAIRIKSLGLSVKEFTKDKYPETMMNPYLAQTYKITLNKGKITINVAGQNLTWTDPYPIKGIKWVGISTWDSEVNFKKIALKGLTTKAKTPAASKTKAAAADAAAPEEAEAEAAPAE